MGERQTRKKKKKKAATNHCYENPICAPLLRLGTLVETVALVLDTASMLRLRLYKVPPEPNTLGAKILRKNCPPCAPLLEGSKSMLAPNVWFKGKAHTSSSRNAVKGIFKKWRGRGRRRGITMLLASSSWNSIDRCHTRQLAGHCCLAELVQGGKSQEGQN